MVTITIRNSKFLDVLVNEKIGVHHQCCHA